MEERVMTGEVFRRKRTGFKRRERLMSLIFIAPMALQFFVLVLGFLLYACVMSFTDWNVVAHTSGFLGFGNYGKIFRDPLFWKSIANTLFLMLGIPVGIVLGVALAVLLNRKIPGRTAFRVIIYLPAVSGAVAVACLWQLMYQEESGIINSFLAIFNITGPGWLTDPKWVKPSLIVMSTWRGVGGTTLLFLAGMQTIPDDYYEAMGIDGANGFQKFLYITCPLLTPTLFYVTVTGIIGGLQAFGDQQIMTGVGPENSAITVVYYLWQVGFDSYQLGTASAVSVILGVAILAVTLVQFKTSKKWVYDAS